MQKAVSIVLIFTSLGIFLITALINKIFTNNYLQKVKGVSSVNIKSKSIEKAFEEIIYPNNQIYGSKDIKIFTYHYIEYVKDDKDTLRKSLNIDPQTFEKQLGTIKQKGYKDIFVKEVPNILLSSDNNKYIALTFDDGYRDFYEYAYPLLKKYNIKATFYIVPNLLNKHNYLTFSQLTEISQSGLVEIGSHGMNHIDLTSKLADPNYEIYESKKYLESVLHKKVFSFCYPYGKYNKNLVQIVKKAGYISAVSTDEGSNQDSNNVYNLQRISAGGLVNYLK